MELSVIVPLYNEEQNVEPLYEAIVSVIDPLSIDFEILLVDDGSRDGTFSKARELARKDRRLRVIRFRRNYGQTPAMAAGFDHARGKILVTMDGDLQNDPADIPMFLEKIAEGNDIVCGWRHKRQDKLISRKIPSIIANRIIGRITGVPIKDNGCSLKAYRADVIRSIPLYSDMHRFIPAMSSLAGTNIAQIKVNHHPRRFGVSKYGITRIYKVLVDLIVIKTILSFAHRPIVLFGTVGIVAGLAGGLLAIYAAVPQSMGGYPGSFMLASASLLLLILGAFFVSTGLLCEMIYRTGKYRRLSGIKCTVE
jgi:glycosyltransferase involved in cell wall biosynthesis